MLPVYQIVIGSKSKVSGTNDGFISEKQLEWIKSRVKRYAIGYSYDKRIGWFDGYEEESYWFTVIATDYDKLVGLCSDLRENFEQQSVLLIHTGIAQFIDNTFTRRAQKAAKAIGKSATARGKLPSGSTPLPSGTRTPRVAAIRP